ncbi:MAG: protein kinase, partial [Alistipes sp.]|nr:protein kinase [Alistipes sp.]
MELLTGTTLQQGRYRIVRALGRGGFGITYLAEQVLAKRKVCIKEFFPKDYYKRDGDSQHITLSSDGFGETMGRFKDKFLKEAQLIAGLDHPNIIRIHDVFEENGTAYYVMEYIEGESLQSIVSQRGAMSEAEATNYIAQLASALSYIHSYDVAHLDVKPGNIMVRAKDNHAVLIDFGLSKHYDVGGMQTSSTPIGISHGYAPMEQYQVGGVSTFSPRTDIYSMGATLYFLLVGKTPPTAAAVSEDGLDEMPSHLSKSTRIAIERAMQPRRKDRPASAEEFMSMLNGADENTTIELQSQPQQTPSKPTDNNPKRSKWWLWLLLLLAVVGIVCGIVLSGGEDRKEDIVVTPDTEEVVENIEPEPEPVVLPDPILTLTSKSSVKLGADGGGGKISYTLTNERDDIQLSVRSNADWLVVNRSGNTISYTTTANNNESSRTAKITVQYGDQSFEVVITQAGKPKPVVPEEKTYKVGDYYNENGKQGVVFEVWDGGRHGKIVSLDETQAEWDSRAIDGNSPRTYADSKSDGKANTDKIMSR